ncbi:MAG: ABC transporter [Pseudomonadales bacterium]|jgi:predicted unusual protein kinase regulating ubiquinone biosynthesis (AarF/ABC1/UbiB family)|uniref:ABC1 kinase family protein n=1 Tax=unclassified Ketobacter TaxID=2639109 RepID=UPI000C392BE5|nr:MULTISPECIES: AarF/ABC1/UbiB kinase family protein [unclassified Ketobacter]MAA60916.1 ABC transporter [Pseudomonadales bacterium]TNC89464.1 MAG: ABC transporter [Alcanivorax sp.]HAG93247.1 ABC transporter [Gammaproteobacteria bacterium]MAQ23890.1 ABC transporter [Pseudomonadales bacterium]MBI26125.1 ABC transporter [Pseudomonadales bacterium]|tara:strand:+ start:3970 stop:5364 length:1395 start_codon:yes stop_codon:yes gene_type:complete
MSEKPKSTLKRVKTGAFERRFSMARAGLVAGTMLAAQSAGNMFTRKEERAGKQKEILSRQAHYLADEIGKLKGSIVKIGQMMALYGEHFLPLEVTEALHTLEDDTAALEWTTIYEELEDELGAEKLALLEIEEEPLGAASIGQVHKAVIKATGEEICLKIQYPGVAEAVDSDLGAVESLLRMLKIVPITEEFRSWFQEIREMMYREVDYAHEREKTKLFRQRLEDDPRFIVPRVYDEFCSKRVIATSYEPGADIDAPATKALSQARRNTICRSALDLCWKEVFLWGEMQTDPNFGNYFVRLGDGANEPDRIVLLDFGAVREFSDKTLEPGRKIVKAAFLHDETLLLEGLETLSLFNSNTPAEAKRGLVQLCFMAIEPFADPERFPPPSYLLNDALEYKWGESNLPARLSMKAGLSAAGANRHFTIPPRELMFLVRKIMGAYTFMSVLQAEIKGYDVLAPYITDC